MRYALIALALAAAVPCGAQTTSQPASAGEVRAAEELLSVMDMEKTTRDGIEMMLSQQEAQNPMMKQFSGIMRDFLNRYMKWEDMKPEIVRVYTDVYTEDELRQLVAFYRTPLGQRVIATLPQVMARSSEIGQRRVQEHLPELMQRITEEMQKSGAAPKP